MPQNTPRVVQKIWSLGILKYFKNRNLNKRTIKWKNGSEGA